MRVNVVGRGFEQAARGGFGFAYLTGAEVQICQLIIQLRGVGIGTECSFVLLHSVPHVFRPAGGDRFFLVNVREGGMVVGLTAVRF